MKAIVVQNPGNESRLAIGDVDAPKIGPDEVLLAVRATAVNRADLLQRRGLYPPPEGASSILGLEAAGEVVEIGSAVAGWKPGDRAMALLPGGGYAAEAAVHAGSLLPVPDALSMEEAGAFPEVFLTAFLNLFRLAGLEKGQAALVHAGGSGVGTAALALCVEAGVRFFTTAGSDEKCAACVERGAERAINYRTEDFAEVVREATGGRGVDAVLDCIGASYLEKNLESLAVGGKLVVIGLMGGMKAEANLATLLLKRLSIMGSTLRARPVDEKAAIVSAFLERFGDALSAGRIRPVVHRTFPVEEAEAAHDLMASNAHFGKIVLTIPRI